MATWTAVILSLSLCLALAALLRRNKRRLPPGPPAFPIIGNLFWFTRSVSQFWYGLREVRDRYGPIVTLHVGSHPTIIVADRDLAHEMLVQYGAVFADRPKPSAAIRFLSSNQHNISASGYGPLWRLLRRNLTLEFLNPLRIKQYAESREWVLGILLNELRGRARSEDGTVVVVESFQYAIFCLLVLLCFGEKLDEKATRDIRKAQRDLLLFGTKVNVFAFVPRIAKYVFRSRWNRLVELRRRQMDIHVPLITARRQQREGRTPGENSFHFSYVDSLLALELPEENGRELRDEEIVALCSEFLSAGSDTTSTALQWIMANLVKHQRIQARLFEEIAAVAGEGEELTEEDLKKLPYLKGVVLEGLRRHPPVHFVLSHAVTEEVSFKGYLIPKGADINFAVAEISLDGRVWSEPLEFRPERFLPGGEGEGVDITGSKEIKMMPFGVGRRICPGLGLALHHLQYFVAHLVREFEWKEVEGEGVDLSEKAGFNVVMKNPLRARILPRRK